MAASATTAVAELLSTAVHQPQDPAVAYRAKQHLLDGLIALISGSALRPGRIAAAYARATGGVGESTVAGTPHRTNAETAAFANAISAHADETDDVNNRARVHPGSSVVPAALAVAESRDCTGAALLRAMALGYDLTCSMNIGAWSTFAAMQRSVRTSHGLGQTFGSAAAAAALSDLSVEQCRHVLSYAAQQVAGIATFYRDPEHIGKAFTTAAMQAHAGVRAVELVRHGFTAVDDILDGSPNLFDAFGDGGSAERVLADLRANRHVMTTDIKQYPVGGPIQAAVQALHALMERERIGADDVVRVDAHLPTQGAYIVDNRSMPDISLQYILAVLLQDGRVTFENSHDYERHHAPDVRALMGRIHAVPAPAFDVHDESNLDNRRTWHALVEVRTTEGRTLVERVDVCRGDHDNPMSWDELIGKAHMVLDEVLGIDRVTDLAAWVLDVETAPTVRQLRPFLQNIRASVDDITHAPTH